MDSEMDEVDCIFCTASRFRRKSWRLHCSRNHPNAYAVHLGLGDIGYRPPQPGMYLCDICDLYLESSDASVISDHEVTSFHYSQSQKRSVKKAHAQAEEDPEEDDDQHDCEVDNDDFSHDKYDEEYRDDYVEPFAQLEDVLYSSQRRDERTTHDAHGGDERTTQGDGGHEGVEDAQYLCNSDADWLGRDPALPFATDVLIGEVILLPFDCANPLTYISDPGSLACNWRGYHRVRVVDTSCDLQGRVSTFLSFHLTTALLVFGFGSPLLNRPW